MVSTTSETVTTNNLPLSLACKSRVTDTSTTPFGKVSPPPPPALFKAYDAVTA